MPDQSMSWRKIQDRKIEKTQRVWVEVFNQKIAANQLQLLVHGSKQYGIHGFKSYEALWVWMRDCKLPGQKPNGDAFLYAKALAKDWGGVKGYSQRAWGRMKDAQVMADVLDEIKIRHGKT